MKKRRVVAGRTERRRCNFRTHLVPKPAQNTLNHVQRSLKVTHFWITETPTRDCVLLYNNVGFRVGNFEEIFNIYVSDAPFSRTPLSFGAPCLGNSCECEYSQNNVIPLVTTFIHLHFCRRLRLSSFVFLWWMLWVKQLARKPSLTWNIQLSIQGRSRSFILQSITSRQRIAYRDKILLSLSLKFPKKQPPN